MMHLQQKVGTRLLGRSDRQMGFVNITIRIEKTNGFYEESL